MKLTSITFLFIFFISCKTKEITTTKIEVNDSVAASLINEKPTLILSCIKCGCYIDVLNYYNETNRPLLEKYDLLIDTTCSAGLKNRALYKHISVKKIDSLYEDNYNIILLKKLNGKIESILLETAASKKFDEILASFAK